MNARASSRHEGTLGDVFLPFGETNQAPVTVRVSPETATSAATQHAAWMLVNLLARLDRVVQEVRIDCPQGVPLAGRIVPLAGRVMELREALLQGGRAIDVVPVALGACRGIVLMAGASLPHEGVDLYVHGNGWCGGFSREWTSITPESHLPFGPYAAACLAVGEVFKGARLRSSEHDQTQAAFYSLWSLKSADNPEHSLSPSTINCRVEAGLAGAGAVGTAFLHTLWATPGVHGKLVIADDDPLEESNLNRYAIFGRESLSRPKASEAARMLTGSDLHIDAHDFRFENLATCPPRVVSAVDKNQARAAIQGRYPHRVLSASTLDLRAEVLRCGPPGVGACLRCYNTPERPEPDDKVRERVRALPEHELLGLANATGLRLGDARQWAAHGGCGVAGERLLPLLRRDQDEPAFSVGFVSVLAGVMLAAAMVKDCLRADVPLNDQLQRAVFQFLRPLARTNTASAYLRDPQCPMCAPASVATGIWAGRHASLN